jgi:hypothetical protein
LRLRGEGQQQHQRNIIIFFMTLSFVPQKSGGRNADHRAVDQRGGHDGAAGEA